MYWNILTGGDGVVVMKNTYPSIHLLTPDLPAVYPLNPNPGKSGPMLLIAMRLMCTTNTDELFEEILFPLLIIELHCGGGEMIFKMILPPAWTGAHSHIGKLTTPLPRL